MISQSSSDSGKITLSIIIPTYNCDQYVRECLDSVLHGIPDQTELIVVDDGSDDSTKVILSEYDNSDMTKVIYSSHKGSSGARNTGIDNARGEFFTKVSALSKTRPIFISLASRDTSFPERNSCGLFPTGHFLPYPTSPTNIFAHANF